MSYKTIILSAVAIFGTLSLPTTQAAISPECFCRSRSIEFDKIEKDTLIAVPLADDVYEAIDSEFSNLQVFDSEGNPVACEVIRKSLSKEYRLPDKSVKIELDEERNRTLITLDTKKRPISRVEFQTPDRNFRRTVEVFAPRSSSSKEVLQTGQISRIDLDGIEQEKLFLTLTEQRVSKLRLQIIHHENRPIEIAKIRLEGPTYECRFIAQPERKYTLEYGSESPISVQLDTAALDAARDNSLTPITASLGGKVIQRKPIKPDSEASLDTILSNPWLIYPIVILLIVLLALGLFFAAKRVKFEE